MNKYLTSYARNHLKAGLSQLTESYQMMFKRMYSYNNIELDINTVVDNIPDKKLDWAMQQVEKTIETTENK